MNNTVKETLEKLAGVVSPLNDVVDILKDVAESNTAFSQDVDFYYRAFAEMHRGFTTWLVLTNLSAGAATKEKAASEKENANKKCETL